MSEKKLTSLDNIVKNTTETFKHNTMQIAVFQINDDNYYGINVNKIKNFIQLKSVHITKLHDDNYEGIAVIRDETHPLISIDKWLGNEPLSVNDYKNIIIAEFNQQHIGFLCSKILRIYNKSSNELEHSKIMENKITYTTSLDLNENEEKLCLILDVENLLNDISNHSENKLKEIENEVPIENSDKEVLIVEDSSSARTIISSIMNKLKIKYQLFGDGQKIIDYLSKKNDFSNIGLIITDIEMPIKDGFQVIQYVKNRNETSNIPIYANTSMSNEGVVNKAKIFGAGFIKKTSPQEIANLVKKYC